LFLSLRHLLPCALLISCSVYDDSLLDDVQSSVGRGGTESSTAGTSNASTAGKGSLGGTSGDIETGGSGEPGTAGSAAGTTSVGGSSPTTTAGTSAGGTSSTEGGTGTATGGTGAGGTPNPPTVVDVMDDMEDGNFYLFAKPPRYGYWYLAGDATSGASLPKIENLVASLEPARGDSTSAVHFKATGFKGWGVSVGLVFADSKQQKAAYDGGNAVGVSFWVRGSVTNSAKLKVMFPIAGTAEGSSDCGGTEQGPCLDHFATQVSVTDEWKQVTILFSNVHQAGWGAALDGFDAAHMLGIEWTVALADADVWIDDVALLRP
jgi:hypothetical protein